MAVNPNIQAPVPLAGRGMVHRPNGKYGQGEYRRLIDVEINDEGQLISRRPIRATAPSEIDYQRFTDPWGFIGNWGPAGVVVDKDGVYTVSDYANYDGIRIWEMLDLPCDAPAGGTLFKHYPFGFHHYNNIDHMVSFRTRNVNPGAVSYHVYTRDDISDVPVYSVSEFAGFTDHTVLSSTLNNPEAMTKPVRSFIHKDRLWIITQNYAYFSKATDFTNFTPPDGGFYKFNQEVINDAIAIKDSIYIICDSAVYLITYTTDPNVDSTVRKISEGVGGDSACIYRDALFFIKGQELYTVGGLNVVKSYDLDTLWEHDISSLSSNLKTKVVAFGDYLVFLRISQFYYASDGQPVGGGAPYTVPATATTPKPFNLMNTMKQYADPASLTELPPSLVFLNMNTGVVHGVIFSDSNETADSWSRGYPCDIFASPVEGVFNSFSLFILSQKVLVDTASGFSYYMRREVPNFDDIPAKDEAFNYDTNVASFVNYHTEIELPSFTPDGSEYNIKKFRNLELSGKLPYDGCRVSFAYDNRGFGTPREITQDTLIDKVTSRPPFPLRVPTNQRARSISVRFDLDPAAGVTDKQDISITDMRFLWGYTKRAPDTNNAVNS